MPGFHAFFITREFFFSVLDFATSFLEEAQIVTHEKLLWYNVYDELAFEVLTYGAMDLYR